MKVWESIFMQSPVNDGCYEEDDLPHVNWDWPKATWFQSRLDYVREHEPIGNVRTLRKLGNHAREPRA